MSGNNCREIHYQQDKQEIRAPLYSPGTGISQYTSGIAIRIALF
jgi:hypothetical protein